jgi:hypothetical protein
MLMAVMLCPENVRLQEQYGCALRRARTDNGTENPGCRLLRICKHGFHGLASVLADHSLNLTQDVSLGCRTTENEAGKSHDDNDQG